MKAISLHLKEHVFKESEELIAMLKIPRNRYINDAVEFYNKYQKNKILQKKLQEESDLVRENSMNVLKDFEDIEYGDPSV